MGLNDMLIVMKKIYSNNKYFKYFKRLKVTNNFSRFDLKDQT